MRQWDIRGVLSLAAVALIPACRDGEPAAGDPAPLYYRVVDAEYSRPLDAIISVSADPNQLHVYDPVSRAETEVNLPLPPTCVSVSPDGTRAAVGHRGWISIVRLSPATLLRTVAVAAEVSDVVLSGNGHAYAFHRSGDLRHLRCVNLRTGREVPALGGEIAPDEKGRLHPNGLDLYVARRAAPHLDRYGIVSGRAERIGSAPPGAGPSGGDLWFSEEGRLLFTRQGTALAAAGSPDEDMARAGTLAGVARVESLAHSAAAGRVAAIPAGSANEDSEVRLYDDHVLRLQKRFVLPYLSGGGAPRPALGRFVFFSAAGDRYFVVAKAAAVERGAPEWVVFTFDLGFTGETLPPPTGVAAAATGATARLRWNAVPGAAAYNVYRAAVSGVAAANHASLPGGFMHAGVRTPQLNVDLSPGLRHHFVVTAIAAGRESRESAEVAITPRPGVFPPRPPAGVAAAPGEAGVAVKWEAAREASSYNIYVDEATEVGRLRFIRKFSVVASPHVVTGLETGRAVHIAVTAVNSAGESAESARVSAFPAEPGPPIRPLRHRVVDAEFSSPLGRIVMVSGSPNRLTVYDPVTGQERGVTLPLAPRCVSVSPGGLDAVVGHNGSISHVDLARATFRKLLPVGADVGDVVLAGNGYAYAFPRAGPAAGIRCVSLEHGLDPWSGGGATLPGTKAQLHPGGGDLYAVSPAAVPPDVERYSLGLGATTLLRDSPYRGDFAVGANLWMLEVGERLVTSRGTVFRASDDPAEDLLYGGVLPGVGLVESLDHSRTGGRVAVIPGAGAGAPPGQDTRLWLFDDDCLGFVGSRALPRFGAGSKSVAGRGRFVFFSRDGRSCFVLVQSAPGARPGGDFGVVTYPVR